MPRRLIDSNGQPVWQWAITGFGELEPTTAQTGWIRERLGTAGQISNTTAVSFNLRYPGQQFDSETGLFYNHHRTYDPYLTVGYTEADPLGLAAGWNRFGMWGGNALGFADPSGLYVGIDDLVFISGGTIVGLFGQGVSDLLGWQLSGWQDYVGAGIGGAAGGWALLYTGPIVAGVTGGAVTNGTKQVLKNLTGKQCGYNTTSFVADTFTGGFTGLIPGFRISGITSGRGSWNFLFRKMSTQFKNGTISNISFRTALKMGGGRAVDTALVPGMFAGSFSGTYLEPFIPGYGDACTCPVSR